MTARPLSRRATLAKAGSHSYKPVPYADAMGKNFLDGILIRSYVVSTSDVFLLSHNKWQTESALEQASPDANRTALAEEGGE